ncbi:glycosyltransferase family 2 protein [Rosenbergiella australiborealis]|uniref:glycosyltransferase family 2 protein n=1 Tax=Rosenbergiella australiborealis TaxID=1544696 RepID=UPI001F4E4CCB|nr:glycosyltransferase family 2 protein [Rosenbergiella australiborealis]
MITIIMPVYNGGKYIVDTINSVLNQSFRDFNLIVVDDGSSDDTLSLVKEISKSDTRVKYTSDINRGVASARNIGLSLVETKYISFVDSDDRLHPDFLISLLNRAEETGSEIVTCNYLYVKNNSTKIVDVYRGERPESYIKSLLGSDLWGVLWNKLFLTSFIRKNGLNFIDGINVWEDLLFSISCYSHAKKIAHVDEGLYIYISRENSLVTKKTTLESIDEMLFVIDKISIISSVVNNYVNELNGMKLGAKNNLLMDRDLYDYSRWISNENISIKYIINSKTSLKIKIFALFAYFHLQVVNDLIIYLKNKVSR